MVGGEAASSTKGGTLGGVAVLTRTHHQARTAQHFCIEGCGFSAVELRVKGVSLLLLSVYLKNSSPLHCPPNAEILSRLVAIFKHHTGHWLVAGDFTVEPQEIAVTTLVQEIGGQIICTGEPTMHGGSELDFVLVNQALEGFISVKADWSAPHRPHASLCIEVHILGQKDRTSRLPEFPVRDAAEDCRLSPVPPLEKPVCVMGQDFTTDPLSCQLSVLSR